ncbi:MAG: ABC transporter substrate-binding protein [Microbacteriaceae bacterium]|nr:MAG: ABC transporter substrate-binding protein [Microbacteriaceae bacterium]
MNRRIPLLATAAAVALALAGCTTGTGVDLGGSSSGATFVAAIGGEPDQLDPHKTSSYFSFEVLENVFDTLVQPDDQLQMEPALATSWETSDDQLTWTFHLRDDVTFQDGSAFTAADVVYSYERIIDENLSNAWKFSSVASVTASDDTTVVITLTQPTPNLLSNLGGFKGMAIVQKKNVEDGDIATAPIGTGPYQLTEYVAGDHITLTANPDYWGGAPKIETIEYKFISEPATALAALKSGEIQWTDVVPPQQVDSLEDDSSISVGVTPSSDYWYLALNEAKAPWNDVKVRQAIAYAIDRTAIIQAVSYGTAQANQLAIPEASAWYTEYDTYPQTADLDTAKQLLAEAGYTGGTLDMLATSDYPETVTAAQIIASNLEPLGITVNIRQPDFSTWLDEQNSGNFDMLMMGWLGNIDPDDFYYAQHHTDGSSNAQKYSNAEVDAFLDAGRVETDQDKRKDDYAQAAKIIADEASYIYLYNPAVIQIWSPKLEGYEARADRAIRFKDASLAK